MLYGCEEARRYVDAWVDGELDPGASLLVETHIGSCGGCRDEADMIRSLKRAMAGMREAKGASQPLRARVLAALDQEEQSQNAEAAHERKRRHATGFVLAGAALAGAILITGRQTTTTPSDMQVAGAGMFPSVLEDIASRHARDLPVEVRASQPDQVENFFRGRLDIPVRPVAFRGVHAQLVGARISNVRDHMAAALFYDVAGRRVTVFVFDASLLPKQPAGPVFRTMVNNQPVFVGNAHGYTVAFSEHDGVGYAVASDLPPQDTIRIVGQAEIQ
jgi:anti-sigma factor RsiW